MKTKYAQDNSPAKITIEEGDVLLLEEVVLPLKVRHPVRRKKQSQASNKPRTTSPKAEIAVNKVKAQIKENTTKISRFAGGGLFRRDKPSFSG